MEYVTNGSEDLSWLLVIDDSARVDELLHVEEQKTSNAEDDKNPRLVGFDPRS